MVPQKYPFSVHHVVDKAKFVSVKKIDGKLSVRAYLTGGYRGVPEGLGLKTNFGKILPSTFHRNWCS